MLASTPLTAWHRSHGARLVPFAGYEMPVQYQSILDETRAVRASGGLFDVSHMAQLSVRGAGAATALAQLVTNDPEAMAVGQAQYNFLCNEQGGVQDDLVVYRRADDWFFVVANAANRAKVADFFRTHLARSASFADDSEATALIAVQGPRAEELLARGSKTPDVLRSLRFYWAAETALWGLPCFVSRTGYTGEDGFEVYADNAHAAGLWERLVAEGAALGIAPAGLGSRDTLRIEMGYPLYGQEISETITPLEVNYRWAVKLDRPTPFVGQNALRRQLGDGIARKLVGLVVEGRRIPRTGAVVLNAKGEPLGTVTSGTFSPHREGPVALALLDRAQAVPGACVVRLGEGSAAATTAAQITALPFVPAKTKKTPPAPSKS